LACPLELHAAIRGAHGEGAGLSRERVRQIVSSS